jgi:hypothetical protein
MAAIRKPQHCDPGSASRTEYTRRSIFCGIDYEAIRFSVIPNFDFEFHRLISVTEAILSRTCWPVKSTKVQESFVSSGNVTNVTAT